MTIKLAFDFDVAKRLHETVQACADAIAYVPCSTDEADIVIVGEADKCRKYLSDRKTVVFCPADGESRHISAAGRTATALNRRLLVVGSEKTPGLFDTIGMAVAVADNYKRHGDESP